MYKIFGEVQGLCVDVEGARIPGFLPQILSASGISTMPYPPPANLKLQVNHNKLVRKKAWASILTYEYANEKFPEAEKPLIYY